MTFIHPAGSESDGADRDHNREQHPWRKMERGSIYPGLILFGVIGATAAAVTVGQLRRTARRFVDQRNGTNSTRGSRMEEAWNRYDRRIQEEYEEEMERVEHIKRVQSVFNRERSKNKKTYETWADHNPGAYQYFQRDDWYWKTDEYYRDRTTNYRSSTKENGNYIMSHRYSVLGLDRSRSVPYSDDEIKNAFRKKAKEYHPDQNLDNREAAEAKFKEIMSSYEAIKLERRDDCS